MKKNYILLTLALLLSIQLFAQKKYNVIVYTNENENFWLTLNGVKQNEEPTTNVKVTDLNAQNYAIKIIFENKHKEPLEKTLWLPEQSSEITYRIKKKKKGNLVLRMFSVVPLQESVIQKSDKSVVKYTPVPRNATESTKVVTTTTTVSGGKKKGNKGGSISVNIGDNSFGLDVNINDSDADTDKEVVVTETITTTTQEPEVVYEIVEEGCRFPIENGELNRAKESISSKSFPDTRISIAKQIIDNNCFDANQVKNLVSIFTFEDSKLEVAKYAYHKTIDKENYYKVNDAFDFDMTIEELQDYIRNQQ
ncbi:DUF4476 domain-containing protein [Aureivirga marina]|uniref:DUF4476 domain-containing protein n=1 Tax=Aureivirga marina TaxID=1182451 RepID=UPI0018CB284F|nr:DUF4476 domain-containing protein [Aureivirga marina]